jgi:RNA polymerase sigma factor (sigma-70 family)
MDREGLRGSAAGSLFPSTSWSRIRLAAEGGEAGARRALEDLALRYGAPIRAWLRTRFGSDEARLEDLAQDFFAWALESGFLAKADPARGRFRAFLKAALRNLALDRWRAERAQKRGGELRVASLEDGDGDGEARCTGPADPAAAPDAALDAAWRAEVLAHALERLEARLAAEGRSRAFAVFREYVLDPAPEADYASVAERHGLTVTDVSNILMRTKRRLRDEIRAVVMETVTGPEEFEAEMAWLLGGRGP